MIKNARISMGMTTGIKIYVVCNVDVVLVYIKVSIIITSHLY